MSENKPNDEPKLSTTDRVVKCKCCALPPNMAECLRRPEQFTAVAATNVVESVFAVLGRRKKGVSRAVTAPAN